MTGVGPAAPVAVDRSPAVLTGRVALGVGLAAAAVTGLYAWTGLSLGAAGLLLLAAGLRSGSRRTASAGGVGVVAAGFTAGVVGAPVSVVLAGVTGGVVAWDLGHRAIDVGDQLGRDAATRRLEAVHVATSLLVGGVTAGLGFGVYRTATGGQPVAALVFLVLAAVLVASAVS